MTIKNNVISLFIDSVMWESVGTTRAKVSPTPFLDSLKKEAVTASKLYSHGPYTDAAKTSLFTGRNCLDDFGYLFRENSSPITDFKLFHDQGYETYCVTYPFWLYGKNMRKHIDHRVYTASFMYASEWGGAFKYYSELSKQRELTDDEMLLLKSRLQLFLDSFLWYLEDLKGSKEANLLLHEINKDFDFDVAIKTLKEEYKKFDADSVSFIKDFIEKGQNHILATLDTTHIFSLIDENFLHELVAENKDFFNKVIRNNVKANLWRNLPSLKRLYFGLRRYLKTKNKDHLTFLTNYVLSLTPFQVMLKRWDKPMWRNDNTIHTILEGGLSLIKKRGTDNNKPFYMYLNTDDPHNNISMFAYDIQDKVEVNDEIRVLKDYVNALGINFKGNLLYFLSLRYVDYEIEKFCKQLKELNLWDNTTLLVLSDHGSSYTFYPLHNARVNCFDDECYHIPVLLRHPGFKGVEIDTYQNSKDILPTVCDLVGIEKPEEFAGYSMLDPERPVKDYVMTEYMGPGCPDMTARRMWLSVRDEKYIVAYKVGIYEPFEDGELAEVFDLRKDPDGLYNINYKTNREDIAYLLNPLKERYEEIKKDAYSYLERLKNGEVTV
jgi:arylsulfatase A-like enzyme